MASGTGPADYLVLSGALGKPCTIAMYSQDYLAILHIADQAICTVIIQLGATEHLYELRGKQFEPDGL